MSDEKQARIENEPGEQQGAEAEEKSRARGAQTEKKAPDQDTVKAEDKESVSGKGRDKPAGNFPVVGLGASAGGLEALKSFFGKVPEASGMAYIVAMHLAPHKPSLLPELLQKTTAVPVVMLKDGDSIQPDHIYVVPPKKEISLYNRVIQLLDPVENHLNLPIDFFFRSLAIDLQSRAAAIILSGTGSDGTVGLKEIKNYEGLVLVQSAETAKYDGMPRNAEATGLADMVLAPQDMPQKLVNYFDKRVQVEKPEPEVSESQEWLHKIFALLRVQVGQDFSSYKINTIQRRIKRRMVLNQIEDQETYLRFLRENSNEVQALFRELLIGVTNFFRLKAEAQKKLLPLFHYTLIRGGVLMLGSSESIGSYTNLFESMNSAWKIYRRREVPQSMLQRIEFPTRRPEAANAQDAASEQQPRPDLDRLTRNLVQKHFAPPE